MRCRTYVYIYFFGIWLLLTKSALKGIFTDHCSAREQETYIKWVRSRFDEFFFEYIALVSSIYRHIPYHTMSSSIFHFTWSRFVVTVVVVVGCLCHCLPFSTIDGYSLNQNLCAKAHTHTFFFSKVQCCFFKHIVFFAFLLKLKAAQKPILLNHSRKKKK